MKILKKKLSFILVFTLILSNVFISTTQSQEIGNYVYPDNVSVISYYPDAMYTSTHSTDNNLIQYGYAALDLSTLSISNKDISLRDTTSLSIKTLDGYELSTSYLSHLTLGVCYVASDSSLSSYFLLKYNNETKRYEGNVCAPTISDPYYPFNYSPVGPWRIQSFFIYEEIIDRGGSTTFLSIYPNTNSSMASGTFNVTNADPIFSGIEDKTIKVGTQFDPLDGVSARDYYNHELNISISENTVDTSKAGVYKVTYYADGYSVTRTITVQGDTKPYFEGIKDTTLSVGDDFDPLAGIKALDDEDGDITSNIKVSGEVDVNTVGGYSLNYSITDNDGNTLTASRIVSVIPAGNPTISGATDISLTVNSSFDAKSGVTAKDSSGNDITSKISISGTVDTSKPGKYSLVYSVTDGYNKTSTVTRTITIKDNNKPVFYGEKYQTINVGDSFDPKANVTAKDEEDGDITDKIVVSGSVNTSVEGVYTLEYSVTDSDGNKTTIKRIITVENKNSSVQVQSLIGTDRYDTAALLSKSKFDTAGTVVIANGSALADGLAVTPLATYKNAPILLTTTESLPSATRSEISRLGATSAIIVGGTGVVSSNVESELKSLGLTVERLGGKDRYETSLKVAQYIDKNCYDVSNIVVSYGYGEPDALSIASVAGRDKMPILLTPKDTVTSSVYNWLSSESLNTAYIIGGTGVVSDSVLSSVNKITSENISGNRLGGLDRFATNAKVIERFYGNELDKVYIAKGYELIDALACGPVAALNNGPVVLATDELTEAQKSVLSEKTGKTIIRTGGGIPDGAVTTLKICIK